MVWRWAYDPRVVGSIPALATFEVSILGQGVRTKFVSPQPRSIRGCIVRSYERRLWLHPTICCKS